MNTQKLEDLPFSAIPMALLENLSVDETAYALGLDRREVLAGMIHARNCLLERAGVGRDLKMYNAMMVEPGFREFIRMLSRYVGGTWVCLLTVEELEERSQLFGYFKAIKATLRHTNEGNRHVQAGSHS